MTTGRRDYWRAIALVFSGTATAQMIPLVGSLVIARLYMPAEFEIFLAWLGISAVAGVFITGRFEIALSLEPDGPRRVQAASATFVTTLILLTLLSVVGAIAWPFFSGLLSAVPAPLLWLYVPTVGLVAYVQIWQAWAAAEGRFKALSIMRITQAAAITGFQIGAGLIEPSAVNLALAHVAGAIVGLIVIAWQLPLHRLPEDRKCLFRFWSPYRNFPKFALPSGVINMAGAHLPLVIIGSRYGADAAGYVALAFRTLGAPI